MQALMRLMSHWCEPLPARFMTSDDVTTTATPWTITAALALSPRISHANPRERSKRREASGSNAAADETN